LYLNTRRLGQLALVIGAILLIALPRLLDIGGYIIVDEADRWRWARDFVYALSRGDLAATLVGDGYPGIVPVWAETAWVFLEAARRSMVEGQWIGEPGLYLLFHEWDRPAYLAHQRLPIVLLNIIITLAVVGAVWRLFGKRVALVSGLLIALDPFYLSDSRVNRAEAVITGLMTLSVLALIFYDRQRQLRYVIMSGVFGGLSFLTKIQALALLPAIALTGLLICFSSERIDASCRVENTKRHSLLPTPSNARRSHSLLPTPYSLKQLVKFGVVWILAAGMTWFILWPSMWVTPLKTLSLVYDYTTRKVGAEGVDLFFWGQTYQNADPGPLFYPVVFFMRLTPLALLGLIVAVLRLTFNVLRPLRPKENDELPADPFATGGSAILSRSNFCGVKHAYVPNNAARGRAGSSNLDLLILFIYVLVYALMMTLGSHKQDRYLMPIFLSVDILAAMGLVYVWTWLKSKITPYSVERKAFALPTPYVGWILFAILTISQIITVLPHHPYYYSFFNPLFGGGQTAVRTLRIGWGEGMDQVGEYLAAKPDSRNMVVSSRFTHNMLGFDGELISLTPEGRWTQADYIVLYIQQVQRRAEPSPGFIDYFQARPPEKVITLGDIDYAWIYPLPFTVPANPQVSVIPHQAALLGYSWEVNQETGLQIRLLWENLGIDDDRQLVARLIGVATETAWTTCAPDTNFVTQAQTSGAYVESLCVPVVANLPAGTYTVEFGLTPPLSPPPLREGIEGGVNPFLFPEGWHAARVTSTGEVVDTGEIERLDAIVSETIPVTAKRLDRIYEGRIRLAAYQLEPATPKPGERVKLMLYWQQVKEMLEIVTLTVQLADSRSISLGRSDTILYVPAEEGMETQWLPGQVVTTRHEFELSSELAGPLAGRVEVSLMNEAEVFLRPTTLTGEGLENIIVHFTIAPDVWPDLAQATLVEANWQNGIILRGYSISPTELKPGETISVSLFWETTRPIAENYVVFVHLLDKMGQIEAQSDSLPRAGAYPTGWWLPRWIIEDIHQVVLPEDVSGGRYQLGVGLYRSEDDIRLPLIDGSDSLRAGMIEVRSTASE
jgi:hypothetical protein